MNQQENLQETLLIKSKPVPDANERDLQEIINPQEQREEI